MAENLEHMAMEEREHNRVLRETHSDDEIRAIEGAIVASLAPEDSQLSLRWMLPAMGAGERDRLKLDVALGLLRVHVMHLRHEGDVGHAVGVAGGDGSRDDALEAGVQVFQGRRDGHGVTRLPARGPGIPGG